MGKNLSDFRQMQLLPIACVVVCCCGCALLAFYWETGPSRPLYRGCSLRWDVMRCISGSKEGYWAVSEVLQREHNLLKVIQ